MTVSLKCAAAMGDAVVCKFGCLVPLQSTRVAELAVGEVCVTLLHKHLEGTSVNFNH